MSRHQVNCINKNDRYSPTERITHIGGFNTPTERWRMTQEQAIADIESGRMDLILIVGWFAAAVNFLDRILRHRYEILYCR